MPSKPVGTVTVKVEPDITGFTKSIRAALYALVLLQFLQWLDKRGLLKDGMDPRSEIVDQFIAGQAEDEPPSGD